MKKLSLCIFTGILLTTVSFGQEHSHDQMAHSILVTGSGESTIAPDKAVVRLGTTIQMSKASEAQARVNEIMQKALEGIEKAGVPKRAIRTTGLTLTPIYASGKFSETEKITAFRASNTIEITLEDLKLVGKAIDAGTTAGANELQGVTFGIKDDLNQRTKALAQAAEEAKQKAQTIAKSLDVQLGPLLEVTEGGAQIIPMRAYAMASPSFSGRATAPAAPVEPGELTVHASVTVRYEIGGGAKR
jgi:uncharacterized protein